MSTEGQASFESGPEMRSREEALAWVKEQLKNLFDPEIVAEGVRENGQVENHKELHEIDFSKQPELAPVAGIQLIIGKIENLLNDARKHGMMPHEEKYLGLCLDYLHGVEQETKSAADTVALEAKVPGIRELVEALEHVRADVIHLKERAANDELFHQKQAA